MNHSDNFLFGETHPKEDLGGGISRQIMGFNQQIMLVKVWFESGSIGYLHEHFHSQVTYVESGVFEVTVGNEMKTLRAGDCFYMEPNIKHGATCIESGVLLDMFSPCREDFL